MLGGGWGDALPVSESVCFWLASCHCKSVYSAQFGIKHDRLLSAGCCLWCPIKMKFIAALRASPSPTFFAPLSNAHFLPWWCWCRAHSVRSSCSSCQASHQNGSLQAETEAWCDWCAHLPVSTSPLMCCLYIEPSINTEQAESWAGSLSSISGWQKSLLHAW